VTDAEHRYTGDRADQLLLILRERAYVVDFALAAALPEHTLSLRADLVAVQLTESLFR